MLQGFGTIGEQAKTLRRTMSLPEVVLWQALRSRPGGFKFRRQHPSGRYVADFYCHEARLIVEVDGEAHERGNRPARDAERDRWFAERGFSITRLPAAYVMANPDGAVSAVVHAAEQCRQ